MKNILRFGLTAIGVIFLFSAFAVPETKAQNLVGDILQRMDNHYKALKSLRANIAREKYNSQLDETDKYKGKISLMPGKGRNFSFRLDWTTPKESIAVVNGQYVAYKASTKTAYKGSSDSKTVNDKGGNVLKILSMSKEEIKANYDVQYVGEEKVSGSTPTWHLKLIPKTKASYKFSELWVDGNGMPIMGRVTMSNDDTDTALISGLEKNIKLKAAIFKINLPKGTQIILG